jgi:hypothetical protein
MIARDFVWILFLNDMRNAHFENVQPVMRADTREELVNYVLRELAPEMWREPSGLLSEEPSTDPSSSFAFKTNSREWCKFFRKGSPLEWFNRPDDRELTVDDSAQESEHIRIVPRILDRSDDINKIPMVPS